MTGSKSPVSIGAFVLGPLISPVGTCAPRNLEVFPFARLSDGQLIQARLSLGVFVPAEITELSAADEYMRSVVAQPVPPGLEEHAEIYYERWRDVIGGLAERSVVREVPELLSLPFETWWTAASVAELKAASDEPSS